MSTAITSEQLGAGGLNSNGRPVFIASASTRYVPTDREDLTDQQRLALKTFQLHRRALAIERRDDVYKAVTQSDFTSQKLAHHLIGSPYPVIKDNPTLTDCVSAGRWYEHLGAIMMATWYGYYVKSKPIYRSLRQHSGTTRSIGIALWTSFDCVTWYRGYWRMIGVLPNEVEADRYGVMESRERMEEKKRLWGLFAEYKNEWMRRWDYHVLGIRPGERMSFFSACFFAPWPVRYCQRTDFRIRENDIALGGGQVNEMHLEFSSQNRYVKNPDNPIMQARPEMLHTFPYIYSQPQDAVNLKDR